MARGRLTPKKPGNILCEHVQDFARGVSPGNALRVRGKDGKVAVPAGRELPSFHLIELSGECGVAGSVSSEKVRPIPPGLRARLAYPFREVLVDTASTRTPTRPRQLPLRNVALPGCNASKACPAQAFPEAGSSRAPPAAESGGPAWPVPCTRCCTAP